MTFAELNQTLFGSADQRVMLTRFIVRLPLMSLLMVWLFSRSRTDDLAGRQASSGVQPSVDTSTASLPG